MLNTSLEGTESANTGDVTVANDFRKVALIKDPTSGGSASTSTTMRATKAIKLTGTSGTFAADEKITQSGTNAVGKVVEWDSTNKILFYINEGTVVEVLDEKDQWMEIILIDGKRGWVSSDILRKMQ